MSVQHHWESFLDAIATGQSDKADKAMQQMAMSQKTRVCTADYITEYVELRRLRDAQELADYRDFLAAEAKMHPHMRQTLDRSCNPALSQYAWEQARGD